MTKKKGFTIDPNSPYAGLLEFAKPEDNKRQQADMQRLARLNALTEAFRVLGDAFYGARGSTIVPRQPQQTALYALDRYNALDQDYKTRMQNWRNLALQVAVEDQRIRDTRQWQEGQTEKQMRYQSGEAEKGRGFQAGETAKGREFQAGQVQEQQKYQSERDIKEHGRTLEQIDKQTEGYVSRMKAATGTKEEQKEVKISSGESIPSQYVGYALGLVRDKYGDQQYTTQDKLLKNFLKDESSLTYDEKSELLNRYWKDIKDNYAKAVGAIGSTATVNTGNLPTDMGNIWVNSNLPEAQKYALTVEYAQSVLNYDEATASAFATSVMTDYRSKIKQQSNK